MCGHKGDDPMDGMPIREVGFDLDEYSEGRVLSETESLGQILYNIFVSSPGSNPSQPRRGIGINKYLYRLKGHIDETDLREKVFQNCFPLFQYLTPDDIRIIEEEIRGQTVIQVTIQVHVDGNTRLLMMAFGARADRRNVYYRFHDEVMKGRT